MNTKAGNNFVNSCQQGEIEADGEDDKEWDAWHISFQATMVNILLFQDIQICFYSINDKFAPSYNSAIIELQGSLYSLKSLCTDFRYVTGLYNIILIAEIFYVCSFSYLLKATLVIQICSWITILFFNMKWKYFPYEVLDLFPVLSFPFPCDYW